LPEGMVRRQARVALSHRVLEMRRAGFSEGELRAREAELWQNSIAATKQALTEHFLLDKVAELEKLDVAPDEIEAEIRLLAYQSGESPRRVRARLQKENMLDDLSTQVLERKSLDQILEYATYEDVPLEGPEEVDVEAVAEHAGGPEPEQEEEQGTEEQQESS
jgi:trigger factor